MIAHTLCTVLWIAGVALAAEHEPMLPITTPPIIYTMDYGDKCFTQPQYMSQFEAAPPDLLHLGKAVPIVHCWGPVRLYASQNTYTGDPSDTLSWENIALLTPAALTQRIENIHQTLARLHAIGIREITPYICVFTLAGDHEKRLGFWNFYDHWDQYARWVGSRLPHDPFDWTVRDRKGQFAAESTGGYPYSPSYFAPLHRYNVCINHPDWQEWHRRLIRMIAQVGYDGCFVDNTFPLTCYCRYCKTGFHDWLAANRGQDWVRRLSNGLKPEELTLDSPKIPAELVRRWRLICMADHLGMLRQVGREVKPDFTIFANNSHVNECLTVGSQCERLMFENTSSAGLRCADKPPETEEIVVHVTAGAAKSDRYTHVYSLHDATISADMKAEISLPMEVQVGKTTKLELRVVSVGNGPLYSNDAAAAEDFYLRLCETKSRAETRLTLQPGGPIGGTLFSRKATQPPRCCGPRGPPTGPARTPCNSASVTPTRTPPRRTDFTRTSFHWPRASGVSITWPNCFSPSTCTPEPSISATMSRSCTTRWRRWRMSGS